MENNRVVVKKERPDGPPVFSTEPAGDFPSFESVASTQSLLQAYEPSIHSAMSMAMKTEMSMDLLAMTFETDGLLGKHQISNSNSEAENTIDAIKAKYGNIDEHCVLKSDRMRKVNLVCICDVLKEMQRRKLEELEVASLENYYEVVRDVEKLNINVKWLLQRLDEIKDAITSRDEAKGFTNEKNEWTTKLEANRREVEEKRREVEEKRREMEEKMREVERLDTEIQICEGQVEQLNNSITNRTSKFGKFQNNPLTDGLI